VDEGRRPSVRYNVLKIGSLGFVGCLDSRGYVGLQREAGHAIYMALLGSRTATINWLRLRSWHVIKESLDQVIETLYLIMNFLLFIRYEINSLSYYIWDVQQSILLSRRDPYVVTRHEPF
jgi:hypothetical protein